MLWVGGQYGKSYPKLLIIGESRYEEQFTDSHIIQALLDGDLKGRNRRTFTNFVQAAVGLHYLESGYNSAAFWDRTLYYNYNQTYFPGRPRMPLEWDTRISPQNARSLREILGKFKPTHAVVWGKANWHSVKVDGAELENMGPIPGSEHKLYGAVSVNEHTTMFAYVHHPSTGFSYKEWAPMLKAFLAVLPPTNMAFP